MIIFKSRENQGYCFTMDFIRSQGYEGFFPAMARRDFGVGIKTIYGFDSGSDPLDLAVNKKMSLAAVYIIQQTRDNQEEKIYDGLNKLKAMIAHTPSQKETRKILTKP